MVTGTVWARTPEVCRAPTAKEQWAETLSLAHGDRGVASVISIPTIGLQLSPAHVQARRRVLIGGGGTDARVLRS